jgi:hypothetical protein
MRNFARIAFLSAALRLMLAQVPNANPQTKTFAWQNDPQCCTQESHVEPNGVAINTKTTSVPELGFRVFANVEG